MNRLNIYVRYSGGAYNCRHGKLTASSTSSGQAAAERLGSKLYGPSLQRVERIGAEVNCASLWLATADPTWHAWCWATGLIEFGDVIPEDACHFASGPRRALMQVVAVVARHGQGKSAGALLVPGVPEAPNQKQGMDALLAFERWLEPRNGKKDGYGVVFGPAARKALVAA
jgi:hypothetical protein